MSNETLTTILVILLSVNFVLWIAFLVFLFVQVRKLFSRINEAIEDFHNLSTSVFGSAMKIGAAALGLFKGFQAVKSITTLGDVFEEDDSEEEKNGKKQK